jgi:hypothetical protein
MIAVLAMVALAGCAEQEPPPQWCSNICEKSGGVSFYEKSKTVLSTFCNDGTSFGMDIPEKCDAHGGVKHHGAQELFGWCWCKDGAITNSLGHEE